MRVAVSTFIQPGRAHMACPYCHDDFVIFPMDEKRPNAFLTLQMLAESRDEVRESYHKRMVTLTNAGETIHDCVKLLSDAEWHEAWLRGEARQGPGSPQTSGTGQPAPSSGIHVPGAGFGRRRGRSRRSP